MSVSKIWDYYVVDFPKRGRPKKERCVDVVLGTWMCMNGKKIACYYPNEDEYCNLDEYLQDISMLLNDNWKKFNVKIKGKSGKIMESWSLINVLVIVYENHVNNIVSSRWFGRCTL